jgi:hypothetical protein
MANMYIYRFTQKATHRGKGNSHHNTQKYPKMKPYNVSNPSTAHSARLLSPMRKTEKTRIYFCHVCSQNCTKDTENIFIHSLIHMRYVCQVSMVDRNYRYTFANGSNHTKNWPYTNVLNFYLLKVNSQVSFNTCCFSAERAKLTLSRQELRGRTVPRTSPSGGWSRSRPPDLRLCSLCLRSGQ